MTAAQGLLAGVREAKLAIPLRPDLFHILQDAHRLTRRLESVKAIRTAERARQAEREAQGFRHRRGRRLKVKTPLSQAEAQEAQAIATCDAYLAVVISSWVSLSVTLPIAMIVYWVGSLFRG